MEYNNSASKSNKNFPTDQEKSHAFQSESFQIPIQLLEQNNFDKFNSYINSNKMPKNILNSLLYYCLQTYSKNNKIIEQIKFLISKGANIESKFKYYSDSNKFGPKVDDKDCVTLLMYACLYNNKKLVELFLSTKIINNLDKNGKNALFYLFLNINNSQEADKETANIIRLLIKKGINVNCVAKIEKGNKIYTHSPLSLAATDNLFYSFKELLNNGANLNFITEPEGDTILHIAVKKINHEMIKLILNTNHINLEDRNKEGKTARDLALEIEPDSIIYNLIVEKMSGSDNIERKKSDDLSFEIRSKRDYDPSECSISLSSNYLTDIKDNNVMKNYSIKNESNKKEFAKIKKLLKNYNEKKKSIINKHIKEITNNSTNMKLYVSLKNETQKSTITNNNKNNNIDKLVDYIILENDESQRPVVEIDLLNKKFLDYKKILNNNSNNVNNSNKQRKNVINKITFLNNNIDNNINININKDLSKKSEINKLEENNSSLKKEIEILKKERNDLMKNLQDKNNYISQLEIKNNKQIELLNIKIKNSEKEKNDLNIKIKNLEKEKNDLNIKLKNLEKEKETLNQNIKQIKKEYSELNQKMEKMIKEKENEKLNKIPIIQTIRSNPTYYSQYLNKKFINFNYKSDYIIESLSLDLSDFEVFVKLRIEKEKNIYDTLIKNVQTAVDKSIQNYVVNLYGSHATNLCLPWSDLDVVLIKKQNNENIIDNNNLMILSQLYEYIRNEPWVKECKLISKAAVPIIKLISIEQYNNMSIDISIQDEKHFGLKCVELVKQFIVEYKSLKPLVLAIKNILKMANLNDPYKGGISSYGLILMIVFFLKKQKLSGIDISPGENNCNLGKLFFGFIQFYSFFFKSNKVIININEDSNNNIFTEFDYNNLGFTSNLIIIDPLNSFNNVAKSCTQFCNINLIFIICLNTLQEGCECGCHFNQIGENYDNLNEKHCFLKRIFKSVQRYE